MLARRERAKALTLSLALVVGAALVAPNVAEATINGSGGHPCAGRVFSEMGHIECMVCGGKWVVPSIGCGGSIVTGSIATIGGIVSLNPWAVFGGIVALGIGKWQCDGHCEGKIV
jgi:hypothetical protein